MSHRPVKELLDAAQRLPDRNRYRGDYERHLWLRARVGACVGMGIEPADRDLVELEALVSRHAPVLS